MNFDSPGLRRTLLLPHLRCRPGDRVLDVSLYGRTGHGREPLSLVVKREFPGADVSALYDTQALLEGARRDAATSNVHVELREGAALAIPFESDWFDVAVSSLLFHHLSDTEKGRALAELWRTLKPGGVLYVIDFTTPATILLSLTFLMLRLGDGFAQTRANVAGRLPHLMKSAGFDPVEELAQASALPGTLALFRATKRAC